MQKDPYHQEPEPIQERYYPSFLFKEIVTMGLVFIMVALVLALFFPAGLEDPADPTDNLYIPKPEWYFLFLYQLLKYFPGGWEAIITTVVPAGGFALLLLLPLLDRHSEKRVRKRPLAMLVMGVVLAVLSALTLLGLAA